MADDFTKIEDLSKLIHQIDEYTDKQLKDEESDLEVNNFESNLEESDLKVNNFESNLDESDLEVNNFESNLEESGLEINNFESNLVESDLEVNNFESNLVESDLEVNNFESNKEESDLEVNNFESNKEESDLEVNNFESNKEESDLELYDFGNNIEDNSSKKNFKIHRETLDSSKRHILVADNESILINSKEEIKEIKTFSDNIHYGTIKYGANPAYGILVCEINPKFKNKIIGILKQFDLEDKYYSESIENGELLISQIGEYSALVLYSKLKTFNVKIKLGLTHQIHSSQYYKNDKTGLVSEDNIRQNDFKEVKIK